LFEQLQTQANQFVANREKEMQAEFERQMNAQIQQLEAMNDQSMASGKQTKKRPQSKMAPFPNTVHNADTMNENSFDR
jgi:sensor domain CHASE-containing protein